MIELDTFLDELAAASNDYNDLLEKGDCTNMALQEINDHMDLALSKRAEEILLESEGTICVVEAVTGDDKISMENGSIYGLMTIGVASAILGIKMSWEDTGVSKWVGNYAEDWVLTPLSRSTSDMKEGQIAWILDEVKLKLLSAVRKQSEEDMDLISKFRALTAKARYAQEDWISYYDNQIALVLSLGVFDFRGARDFPFMWKSEGGCGGFPPFKSTPTASFSLYHFNKGKASQAIHGAMREAVALESGTLSIDEVKYLRAIHMAMYDPSKFQKFLSSVIKLKAAGQSEKGISDLLRDMQDFEIPMELQDKVLVLEPKNTFLGGLVSNLRTAGLLMTELDVLVHSQSIERAENFKGDISFRELREQQDRELELAKRQRLTLISEAFPADGNAYLSSGPNPGTDESIEIFNRYFSLNERLRMTSFSRQGVLRVFRTEDVVNAFDNQARRKLIDTISKEAHEWKPEVIKARTKDEKDEFKEKRRFVAELPFTEEEILKVLPKQWGTGDAILLGKMDNILRESESPEHEVFILVTYDSGLIAEAQRRHRNVFAATPRDLVSWTTIIQEKKRTIRKKFKNLFRRSKTKMPNLLTGSAEYLPEKTVKMMRSVLGRDEPLNLHYLFDAANIQHEMQSFTIEGTTFHSYRAGWIRPTSSRKIVWQEFSAIKNTLQERTSARHADHYGNIRF